MTYLNFKSILSKLAVLVALAASASSLAQVSVSGALSGNGTYTSLRLAFTALNASAQTNSDIVITVTGNTTETASAVLNNGAWNSILIKPQGNPVISGNINSALISLNGADKVTIDGLNTEGNSLTCVNTNSSSSWGTCTVLMSNGASYNTVKNCSLKGASQNGSMGVVFINAGAAAANHHNTVTGCYILPASAGTYPVSGVVVRGTSTLPDTFTNVSDNQISDFFSESISSTGISAVYSENLTISGNRIFQTVQRNSNTVNTLIIHRGIYVGTSANTNHNIYGNIIGYADSNKNGKTVYNSVYQTIFRGIDVSPGATAAGTILITDNEIAGIEASNNYTGTNLLAVYVGNGPNYEIKRNTIGSLTSNSSIIFSSTLNNRYIGGISVTSYGSCTLSDNNIGGISTAGTADISYNINCIQVAGTGSFTITGNTIGSGLLSHSIVSGTAGVTVNNAATLYGISVASAGTYSIISNNTIQSITAYSDKNPQIRPIRVAGGTSVSITGNSISGISAGGTGSFTGIQNTAAATNAEISNNTIKNIYLDSGNYYGVTNSGGITGTLTIAGNLFGDSSSPSAIISGSGTLNCYFINTSSSVVHNTMNITANDFRTIQAPDGGANYQYFIYNSAQSYNQNISDNTFTNITVNNSKGAVLFRNDVTLPAGSVQTISNNRNVGPMVKTGAGSFYLYFSAYSGAASNAVSVHSNNNFSNISLPDSAVMYGWYFNNTGNSVKQITNNTFSNWSLGTSNQFAYQLSGFGTGSFIRQNTITNITSAGPFTAIYLGSGGTAEGLHVDNNTFGSITSGSGNLLAVNTINNSPSILIHDNQVSNFTSTSGVTGSVSALAVSGGTGTCSIYNNAISGVVHTGITGSGINGILINGGSTSVVHSNRITDMSLTGTATSGQMSGIAVTGGSTVTLHNNIVGALSAPNASSTLAVIGIRISGASTATLCSVYNNTVYLNASSTGTNFGTAALYHRASSTADIARLVLKNNILINRSSSTGTGFTAALWRSSTILTNYDSASNNNLLYAGVPGTKNLLLYNSSGASGNDQSITAFRARLAPAESNSLIENVMFASVDSSSPAFLHIADGTPSLAESNGSPIATVSTDFDGDTRDGDFPDVGADEFTGATPTLAGISTDEFCSTAAGQPVTITGTNLGLIKYVTFAGASGRLTATIVSQSSTTMTVTTPAGFVNGSLYLNYGGAYLESDPYTVFGEMSGGVLQGSAAVCPGNVSNQLTLGNHNGTIVKWQRSLVADFSSGVTDIASTSDNLTINQLSQTTFYRVVVSTSCGLTYSTVASLSVITTTWNGTSWSNGLPDATKVVVIAAPLVVSADMEACTLTISNNALVAVAANTDIAVTGSVTVNSGSSLTFAPASNLLQLTDAANTGNIVVQQRSASLFRLDYTLWSSPVTGSQTLQQFSPNTSSTRFYTYNTLTNTYNSVNAASSVFASGKGYLIRMPNSWIPYNAANPQPAAWTGSFTGVPNNGPVTLSLSNGGTTDTRFNAVGNPYPSAIDITDFISANSNAIDGTVWLWRKTNDQNNPVSYSTCTAAGCTRNNGFSGYQDDTVLEKGQGFIVKLKPGSTSLTFTNAMRRGDNNLQFFRQAEKNRYWLDITNNNNSFAQLLVAHMPGGTPEYDEGLDGIYFNESPTFLGTASGEKLLSVEARGDFESRDVVPLYFSTNLNGEFTISLNNAEGIFSSVQAIYLKDKDTGIIHNLSLGGYTFHTTPGVFKNRFAIIYQVTAAKPSATPVSKSAELTAINDNGKLSVLLKGDTIEAVTVHDITGKELLHKDNIASQAFSSDRLDLQHQLFIIKVTATSGTVYTKKIIF